MTNHDLARTLDAVANQMQVVAGLTTELRQSIGADAQKLVDLEGVVDRVVRLLKRVPPKNREDV
jgi:ABC-type transporter Mla subunit MlaD